MAEGRTSGSPTPGECVELASARLRSGDELSTQTLARIELLMAQFSTFVERAYAVRELEDVRPEMVTAYLSAPRTDGNDPGVSLQHFRRLAVRVLFRSCRSAGIVQGDPSLDAELPPRTRAEFRPLDDEEVGLCRAAVSGSLRRIRSAVAWALCEATARTGELPKVSVGDLDLESGRVWIAETPRTLARWGHLTDWGLTQVRRYVEQLDCESTAPLVCGSVDAALAQSSAVGMISKTMTYAGLGDAPGVRPSSVAAWAGRRIFRDTGRIDVAAQRLGMRSLDRTAVFIGWDWSSADD